MNAELLELRPAGEEDRPFCYEVKKAALRAYVEPIWGWNEHEQTEFHHRDWRVQKPEIITLDGEDIGTIEIGRGEDGLHLGEFYLLPKHQRRGIGSYLLKMLAAEADGEGRRVKLEVIKINPVRSLYERFGFAITGETTTHFLMTREPDPS